MAENSITHEVILEDLREKFPNKDWNEESIYRWCQQTETIYIADPDSMVRYLEIPIDVTGGKVQLPANLYKLLDVYDNRDGNARRVRYNRMKSVLKQLVNESDSRKYDGDVIWLNYIGTALDSNCMPLIDENHFPSCETLCKINGFELEATYGEINMSIYMDWKQRFDGMIQGAKSDIRDWDSQTWKDLLVIHGNEIPKIGYQPLAHKYTNNGTI